MPCAFDGLSDIQHVLQTTWISQMHKQVGMAQTDACHHNPHPSCLIKYRRA